MSKDALRPVALYVDEGSKIYLGRSIDEMSLKDAEDLEDYILEGLKALFNLVGEAPKVGKEGSEECKALKRGLEEYMREHKDDPSYLQQLRERIYSIIERYGELKKEERERKIEEIYAPWKKSKNKKKKKVEEAAD